MTQQSPTQAATEAETHAAPNRAPMASEIPRTFTKQLGDVTIAVNRLSPRRGLKAVAALAKFVGPTLAPLFVQGVEVNGQHMTGSQLAGVIWTLGKASKTNPKAKAKLQGLLDDLLPMIGDTLAGLEPDQLDDLIDRFLVGASAIQLPGSGAVPIITGEQIDALVPDPITLAGMLRFAIGANLRPFGVGNTGAGS